MHKIMPCFYLSPSEQNECLSGFIAIFDKND